MAFRKRLHASLEQLQADLDAWLVTYNEQRTHQGKMCCGRTPWETFEDGRRLAEERVRLFFVDGPRGFCQRHGKSYLTRRRRGGEGGGGGLLTGRAIPSAYRWAWCRWYSPMNA